MDDQFRDGTKKMDDTIYRQSAIETVSKALKGTFVEYQEIAEKMINKIPSAQPETCEGCKHLGKWKNEVEYGYPSPCTRCKRRVDDHYER
jgi:hypothetical protein